MMTLTQRIDNWKIEELRSPSTLLVLIYFLFFTDDYYTS